MIWGALAIPVLTAWVLHQWWPHRTLWWEYVLPLVVCAVLIGSMKACVEHTQVQSTEYWGSVATSAHYYEPWNEYIHKTCSRTHCSGSGNNRRCHTTYYDCSYVRDHSAYWEVRTTLGEVIRVPQAKYDELRMRWGNRQFQDMRRNYHTKDGDMYYTVWPKDSVRLEPVTTTHTYENRVKAADASIFHFELVSDAMADSLGLHDYPGVQHPYTQVALLGARDTAAQRALMHWNAVLGAPKEVKLFVLVFRNKGREYGQLQEWYWKGGNMNEVVVCLGLDDANRVQWCHPMSWGTDHVLQATIRQHVETRDTLDLLGFSRWLGPVVQEHFVRRDFAEFDYLTVEPPTWAVVTTYVLTLVISVLLGVFAVQNEADPWMQTRRW